MTAVICDHLSYLRRICKTAQPVKQSSSRLPCLCEKAGGRRSNPVQPYSEGKVIFVHTADVIAGSPQSYGFRDDGMKNVFAKRRSR